MIFPSIFFWELYNIFFVHVFKTGTVSKSVSKSVSVNFSKYLPKYTFYRCTYKILNPEPQNSCFRRSMCRFILIKWMIQFCSVCHSVQKVHLYSWFLPPSVLFRSLLSGLSPPPPSPKRCRIREQYALWNIASVGPPLRPIWSYLSRVPDYKQNI